MPVARVVLTHQCTFRGAPERWSNKYSFNLPTIDTATVSALAAALITWERTMHANRVSYVYAVGGRDQAGAQAVYAEEFGTPQVGTQTPVIVHPEVCVLAESKRRARVYARKWFHTLMVNGASAANSDALAAADVTNFNTWLAKLTNGTLPGGAVYCWPDGTAVTTPFTVDPWLRTHQFPHRGKRGTGLPPSTP